MDSQADFRGKTMEVNLVTAMTEAEQDGVEVDDFINNDGNSFGGERCGICMDIIIDRGVLDCCQHWFCFGCIDNWATITNLCPLCQNEFQLITCVPVYDTIGSSKAEEDTYSRDNDWLVEGKNNTLSFPSYYIDENAVICLDGCGCKIRNGSVTIEGDANLDTSIACDSCDLWYHAFCVGFDPEGTSESTWLCPRCVVDDTPQKPDETLVQNYANLSLFRNLNNEHLVEDGYSRKVSVSVADSGETAIVVSMVGENKFSEEPSGNVGLIDKVDKDLKTQTFLLTSEENCQKLTTTIKQTSVTESTLKAQELELSLSCDKSLSFPSNYLVKKELVINDDMPINDQCLSECNKSSEECAKELSVSNNSCNSSSDMGLHLGLSMSSVLSGDDLNKSVTIDGVNEGVKQDSSSEECERPAARSAPDADEDVHGTTGVKRKLLDSSTDSDIYTLTNASDHTHLNANEDFEAEIVNEISHKKMRVKERPKPLCLEDQDTSSVINSTENLRCSREPEDDSADIMSIVQGTKRRPSKGQKRSSAGNKSANEAENMTGLRVKKIMKRAGEDNESSIVVQTLRKEIREAVRNKSVKDLGENLFDPKLLAAFRAAVTGPKTESVKMLSQLSAKAKKSMLQKGKVRENLTKKIYALSSGRRKRAWDRDCEVEFWKHRCMRASKPEKIETLKSVLDLLRNGSESTETGQRSDPILSRLYLADTSVFPRKDDIKPLAQIKTSGDSEASNAQRAQAEKRPKPSLEDSNNVALVKDGAAPSKVQSSKSNTRKESTVTSADVKVDKRKWALEVLARRTSGADKSASEKQGDSALLKGNYPLLAQLPVEMRPVLAPSRHNKIPMSVRQAQLYRITEQLLKKANLPVIRRSAETELAVADAINIEKEVADRSNSKPVYINLCSQELLHRSENSKPRGAPEDDISIPSTNSVEELKKSEKVLPTDPTIQALKNAGLLSDSPPNSPDRGTEAQSEEGKPLSEEEEPENVFEMENVPDLDIYGEFEYNLDDEDYIGVSATQASKVQLEEAASKMKLVFSTLNPDKSTNTMDSEKPPSFENANTDTEALNACTTEKQNSTVGSETDGACAPPELLFGKEGEEPSVAECEELYGPDKEPLMKILPMDESVKSYGFTNAQAMLNQAEKSASVGHNSSAGESSPNRSEIVETVRKKEKKSNAEISKRSDSAISKKVEAYIKEHIRPLCKSGIITAEQYRWAVSKTTEKVMKYHGKAKNANFLIKEGEKVKKLAEQYVEAVKQKEKDDSL